MGLRRFEDRAVEGAAAEGRDHAPVRHRPVGAIGGQAGGDGEAVDGAIFVGLDLGRRRALAVDDPADQVCGVPITILEVIEKVIKITPKVPL